MGAIRTSLVLRWLVGLIVGFPLLVAVLITVFGWNWLRGPVERMTLEKTGRALVIGGDITVAFAWPLPRIRAGATSFANPDWAAERQMVTADAVEITLNLSQLLAHTIVLPEVRLIRPVVFLEQASDGRKNWLLDRAQQDEDARIHIDLLTLDQGRLGYDDIAQATSIRAEISSTATADPASATANSASCARPPCSEIASPVPILNGITFTVQGRYKNLPLKAQGSGGPVLGLRDESSPYPLNVDVSIGQIGVKAEGTITSLLKFSAIDMNLRMHGESLAQLYPLLGIALPKTSPYVTRGHLVHSEKTWHYKNFSGRIGQSDIAGTVQIDTDGKRPRLTGDLVSKVLDIADLGPLIGTRQDTPQKKLMQTTRVLPEIPFDASRWDSVDAEVTLKASSIRHADALPLENLVTHLSLRDSMLKLDPLDFGTAGGHLNAVISLDGQRDPIHARALLRVKKIQLAKLFPTIESSQLSIGQLNGEIKLNGQGNSIRTMLANADGNLGLIVSDGQLSRLMLEKIGLHLWEILELKFAGDERVRLRCAVADFSIKNGSMQAEALVFDTEITTILGSGTIDLGKETLDLTLKQKTKNTSPLALRSPIYIHGSFAKPEVGVDKARVAMRGLGAIALGIINPVLALLPLVDAGPGADSDCRQLVRDAKEMSPAKAPGQASGKVSRPVSRQ